jgi:hypothetical protein
VQALVRQCKTGIVSREGSHLVGEGAVIQVKQLEAGTFN